MAEKSKKINKVKKETKKIVPLKKETTKVEKVVKKTANVGAASKSFWKNNKSTIIIVGFIVLLLAVTFLIEGNEKKSTEVDYSSVGTEIKAWYDDTQKDQNVVTVLLYHTVDIVLIINLLLLHYLLKEDLNYIGLK